MQSQKKFVSVSDFSLFFCLIKHYIWKVRFYYAAYISNGISRWQRGIWQRHGQILELTNGYVLVRIVSSVVHILFRIQSATFNRISFSPSFKCILDYGQYYFTRQPKRRTHENWAKQSSKTIHVFHLLRSSKRGWQLSKVLEKEASHYYVRTYKVKWRNVISRISLAQDF